MWVSSKSVAPFLERLHYLGAVSRGFCWSDEHGVLVLAKPTSRRLPQVTTVISYSDPSAGHTGALYKACNWQWKPTWHRLRPPPSGNGSWKGGKVQAVKDRWVYALRPDPRRDDVLSVKDESIARRLALEAA